MFITIRNNLTINNFNKYADLILFGWQTVEIKTTKAFPSKHHKNLTLNIYAAQPSKFLEQHLKMQTYIWLQSSLMGQFITNWVMRSDAQCFHHDLNFWLDCEIPISNSSNKNIFIQRNKNKSELLLCKYLQKISLDLRQMVKNAHWKIKFKKKQDRLWTDFEIA